MTRFATTTLFALAAWIPAVTVCEAQVEAIRAGTPEANAALEEFVDNQRRAMSDAQARFKELSETGVRLFGRNNGAAKGSPASKTQIDKVWSTLDLKHPEKYAVGDWGSPATQTANFRVVQRVADDALLIASQRGSLFWLQGVDPSAAAEDMEFRLPLTVAITGTKTYDSVSGSSRTVLVMECDPEKVLKHAESARKRDEEAGWRVWTITKTIRRAKSKRAPNTIAPKSKANSKPQTPRERTQTQKIMAQLVKADRDKVTLLNRWGLVEGGFGETQETFLLKELSAADRAFIRDRAKGQVRVADVEDETTAPMAKLAPGTQAGGKPAAAVAAKPDKNDSRTRWLNETYNTTVRYVPAKMVWEEVDNKTGRVNWVDQETTRTAEYIELFSPERKAEIRLREKSMEQKLNGKWSWVAKGGWNTATASTNSGENLEP